MAIPFLNHLDLLDVSEIQNAILHKTTSSVATDVEGKIIYDTGSDTIKYYNGSAWINLGGDTVRGISVDTNGDGSVNSTLEISEDLVLKKGNNITLTEAGGVVTISSTDTNTNQLTTWTLRDDDNDDVTIGQGNFIKFASTTGAAGTDTTGAGTTLDPYLVTITSPDTNTQLSQEEVEDYVGGMLDGTETGITVGYNDTNGNIDFVVADTTVAGDTGSTGITPGDTLTIAGGTNVTTAMSGDILTISSTDTNTDTLQSIAAASDDDDKFITFVETATGAQTGMSGANFKFNPGTDTLKVTNLIVSGTQTVQNETIQVVENNTIAFEGTTADEFEIKLTAEDATTTDKVITLPNATGTVALTSDINDATLTVEGSNGLTGTGTFTANDADTTTITLSHADTSGQASVDNSGITVIQDVTLDTYGHVTGLASVDLASGIDGRITAREFKANFPSAGTSAGDTITITHNLGTKDVIVQFYALVADIDGDANTPNVEQYEEVKLANIRATDNTITVTPNTALVASALRVLIKEL